MERPAHPALRALPVARIGFVQRAWVQRHHGIEPRFVLRNAIEILLHDGARGDTPQRIAVCISPMVASTTEKDGCCAGMTCSNPKSAASSNEKRRPKNEKRTGRSWSRHHASIRFSLFVLRSGSAIESNPRCTASCHSGPARSRTESGSAGATAPGCISAWYHPTSCHSPIL